MPVPFYRPSVAPPGALGNRPMPYDTANPLSKLFFQWVGPMLKVGFSRPLEDEGEHGYLCQGAI